MRYRRRRLAAAVGSPACALLLLPAVLGAQPAVPDDFEDGTTMSWGEFTSNELGGPAGLEDNYLEVFSNGGFSQGSRMVAQNVAQWQGDYTQLPLLAVEVDVRCFEGCPLYLRLALEGGGSALCQFDCSADQGSRFVSVESIQIDDGGWQRVLFRLDELMQVDGDDTLDEALTNVRRFRILSSLDGFWRADIAQAVMGIDNVTPLGVVAPEIPTLGDLGRWTLILLLVGLGVLRLRSV